MGLTAVVPNKLKNEAIAKKSRLSPLAVQDTSRYAH
jgi:hypothetical protein